MIAIRRADPQDLDSIAEIECAGDVRWGAGSLAGIFAQPYLTLVGVDASDRPCAFAIGIVAADELQIVNIVVAAEARRCGIGMRLLSELITQAQQMGARACYLEVAVDNDPAIGLYQRAGFREIGRRRGFYADGGDALVMTRKLESEQNRS